VVICITTILFPVLWFFVGAGTFLNSLPAINAKLETIPDRLRFTPLHLKTAIRGYFVRSLIDPYHLGHQPYPASFSLEAVMEELKRDFSDIPGVTVELEIGYLVSRVEPSQGVVAAQSLDRFVIIDHSLSSPYCRRWVEGGSPVQADAMLALCSSKAPPGEPSQYLIGQAIQERYSPSPSPTSF